MNYYIITGGPGAGKTTLLEKLVKRGYNCVPEVARNIIRRQIDSGGNAVPWGDVAEYSRIMLDASIQDFISYSDFSEILFFDRGIPDVYGYNLLTGIDTTVELKNALYDHRYNPIVFILPPWKEIYETDGERKQDFKEAVRTYETMKSVYSGLGYTLVEVPRTSVSERADYVLDYVE